MIRARRINNTKLTFLFVIVLTFLINVTYKSRYIVNESNWPDVLTSRENNAISSNKNTILEKPQKKWPKQSSLLSIAQTSTKLKESIVETVESQIHLKNKISKTRVNNKSSVFVSRLMGNINKSEQVSAMPLCDSNPSDLGPIKANIIYMELDNVEKKYPEVHLGGRYFPPDCIARHKVAIIVPYRDRLGHLPIFLNHMHPFLMKQQIEYGIFIIEQAGSEDFNRAKLMNVGFVEAQRLRAGGWQCFVFHDLDLLPLDTRNMYSCPKQPRHMSASVDKLNFTLPYEEIFGGISALTLEQFIKVNGFSNVYWGWGAEDDDMFYRLHQQNYHIGRYKMSIARYTMIDHKKSDPNIRRYKHLLQTNKTFQIIGLRTLEYKLMRVNRYHLYTHILVNIDDNNETSWWMKLLKRLLIGEEYSLCRPAHLSIYY